jgi:hypothetical protein
MKVICVNKGMNYSITIGKIYDTIDETSASNIFVPFAESNFGLNYYLLINDDGKTDIFPKIRFITLREYNLSKLT